MNYPAGVSGNEYQIAGPDAYLEVTETVLCVNHDCKMFEVEQELEFEAEAYGGEISGNFTCPTCGTEDEWTGEVG